jgi:CheY-like chemotaxis protein
MTSLVKPSLKLGLYSEAGEPVGESGAKPALLIVDDQPLMAEFMASVAEEAGWSVDLALTAKEFEAKVKSGKPDMIALDLAMPGSDGVELLRYLSENLYAGSLIIVSACDESIVETSANLARQRGLAVTGYLQKPITAAAFTAHLDQALARRQASALDRSHQ